MKRYILFVLAIALMSIAACRKDHENAKTGNSTRVVSFGVAANFTNQIIPNSTAIADGRKLVTVTTPTIQNTFDTIFYKAYDLNGNIIHQKTYSAKTFTTVTDTLANGDYKIAIYAGKKGFNGSDYGTNASGYIRFDANTFGSTFPLTVGTSNINQSVTLNRILGELTITVNDAFPANAKRFSITLNGEANSYDTFNATPVTTSYGAIPPPLNMPLPVSFAGTTGYTYTFVTLNTAGSFNISLAAFDNTTQSIAYKTTGLMTLAPNEHLSLSGRLFTNNTSGSSNTTVGIDTTWRPQPVTFTYIQKSK